MQIKENEYFYQKDLELIEKLRQRAKLKADRDQMNKNLALSQKEVLRDLHKMGFSRKTLTLLYLVPLIQVAWSEGTVTKAELRKIIEIALSNEELSKTHYEQLLSWISSKPSDLFFTESLRIIRIIFETLSEEERSTSTNDLISYCTAVANASANLFGRSKKMSNIEKKQILEIAKVLGK